MLGRDFFGSCFTGSVVARRGRVWGQQDNYYPQCITAKNLRTKIQAIWSPENLGRFRSLDQRPLATIALVRAISQRSSLSPRLSTGTLRSRSGGARMSVCGHIGHYDLLGLVIPGIVDAESICRVAGIAAILDVPVSGQSLALPGKSELVASTWCVPDAVIHYCVPKRTAAV